MLTRSARALLMDARVWGGAGRGRMPVDLASLPGLRGHFPGRPVMPAVTILAAMFELAARVASPDEIQVRAVSSARFARPVVPADGSIWLDVRRGLDDDLEFTASASVQADGKRVHVASAAFRAR